MTHALDTECHNSDRATQLNLLSPEELVEMQSPSAPRLRQGKMPPFKADGGRRRIGLRTMLPSLSCRGSK